MSLITQPQPDVASVQLDGLLHGVGIAPLVDLGWLRVTGEDRVRWLNGMVTNSINDLAPGQGCYNFILSAQGRIQGIATAFFQPDSILLETDRTQIAALTATLDRFIIMDDVELTDISATRTGIALIGPGAAALLTRLDLPTPAGLSIQTSRWHDADLTLIGAHSPLVPRFALWSDDSTAEAITAALTQRGAEPASAEALEHLRILEGTPRYGTDIRDRELPQETAQTRALHFAKGCYLGQEIVERIRSRGNVHRTFSGFQIAGQLPAPGTPIEFNGKVIGELTSATAVPFSTGTQQIGLGYIRREALDNQAVLSCADAEVHLISLPVREP